MIHVSDHTASPCTALPPSYPLAATVNVNHYEEPLDMENAFESHFVNLEFNDFGIRFHQKPPMGPLDEHN